MAKDRIIKDKNARCRFCGKTIAELLAAGSEFVPEESHMLAVGTTYHSAVCPLCRDAIDDLIGEWFNNDDLLVDILQNIMPKLLARFTEVLQHPQADIGQ